LAAVITGALIIYFIFSIYFFPQYYLSLSTLKPMPIINSIIISPSKVTLGEPFTVSLIGSNQGDTADYQEIDIAFPNLTNTDISKEGIVQIQKNDLVHKARFIKLGDKIGSNYLGQEKIVEAKYPSIEFYDRPWYSHRINHIDVKITPTKVGRFAIFVKTVAFPNTSELSHYPREGFKDYQAEFVKVYSLNVTRA
jgi:hypothetical protein